MFIDREDAGEKLARALAKYKGRGVLVLAIPRGGVEVGYHVARELEADFSLVVARKLPLPSNPEAGFGAVAEDGSVSISEAARRFVDAGTIQRVIAEQRAEVGRRIRVLRRGEPLPPLEGRTVILVDDGIAMGSTMRAAVAMCRRANAAKVVIAAPVSGPHLAAQMRALADDVVILEKPPAFRAVAQVYANWYDVPDAEVVAIMDRWRRERRKTDGDRNANRGGGSP
jgi:putative phosphoribosyl transferase